MLSQSNRHFVTGGAGFIGSHLVERLLAEGYQVTVYDKLLPSRGGWETPPERAGLRLVQGDLLDLETVQEAIAGHDLVWHLAANTDIPGGIRHTDLDLKNCVIATHNVLEAMRLTGVKRLAFASSGAIYGDIDRRPTPEDCGPLLPLSLYAAGKLACEGFISAYCHAFGMQAWIFRFGNVIGTRMSHGIIYDFLRKLRENPEELEILGDGEQEKNYFLVDECIDGMFHVIRHSAKQCDIYNLGAGTTLKVKEIARIIPEELGLKNVHFRYTGGDRGWPGDQPKVYMDISKVAALGWQAKYSSAEAVRIAVRRLLGKDG